MDELFAFLIDNFVLQQLQNLTRQPFVYQLCLPENLKLYNIRDKFVQTFICRNSKYPSWYTKPLIEVIKDKYIIKYYGNMSDEHVFQLLRK